MEVLINSSNEEALSQVDFQAKKIHSLLLELEAVGADKFALLLRLNGIASLLGVTPPEIEEKIRSLKNIAG